MGRSRRAAAILSGYLADLQQRRVLKWASSEDSIVGPRASSFFAWQRRRSRRCLLVVAMAPDVHRDRRASKGPLAARSRFLAQPCRGPMPWAVKMAPSLPGEERCRQVPALATSASGCCVCFLIRPCHCLDWDWSALIPTGTESGCSF